MAYKPAHTAPSEHASAVTSLRYAAVTFEAPLHLHELPAIRAAIAEKAGLQHHLFHNHLSQGRLAYRYPLIQYKLRHGRLMLLSLQEGVEAVSHFFQKADWQVRVGERPVALAVRDVLIKQYKLLAWDALMSYRLSHWLPFNEENYKLYQQSSLKQRLELLERILTGNLLSMAKGLGWYVADEVKLHIDELSRPKWHSYKGVRHMAFDVQMRTNLFVPDWLGVGRKVSVGFGVIQHIDKKL